MQTTLKTRKETYRTALLKKRQELLLSARSEPEALATNVQSPDMVDFAVQSVEQDLTAVTANLRTRLLKEVEGALKRVSQGTYGICEGCGEEISPNRLKALPWARYCIPCQEMRSRN